MSKRGQRQQLYEAGTSPSEIASAAGCSRPIVYRLLSRGLDRDAIVARFANRTMRKTNQPGARAPVRPPARPARKGKGKVNVKASPSSSPSSSSSPSPGSNGHGHSIPPPFVESQAAKEEALAGLRRLELRTKQGELADVRMIQSWTIEAIAFERGHTFALPTLLREHGHAAAGDLAERLLLHIFHDSDAYMRRRAKSYGIALPPPIPPPPAPDQLPAYIQYMKAAIDGRTAEVPFEQRILSFEWRQAHPSVTIQQEFEIREKKRRWDAAMAELLNARSTWDLPPESNATPKESLEVEEL
jgi:hypothetical protein